MALQAGDKAPNFKLESDAGRVSKAGLVIVPLGLGTLYLNLAWACLG